MQAQIRMTRAMYERSSNRHYMEQWKDFLNVPLKPLVIESSGMLLLA